MENTWIKVEDRLPEYNAQVLLLYKKGKGRGQKGVITEGYLCDEAQDIADRSPHAVNGIHTREFWDKAGYGLTYFDYADRQIQNLSAKNSKNEVTHWMPLPEPPTN